MNCTNYKTKYVLEAKPVLLFILVPDKIYGHTCSQHHHSSYCRLLTIRRCLIFQHVSHNCPSLS